MSMMNLESTCRQFRALCTDPCFWKDVTMLLSQYDHSNTIQPLMACHESTGQHLLRRMVKMMTVLRLLAQPRRGDIWNRSVTRNLNASYRLSHFLPTIPDAWKSIYFCMYMDKPTHQWRMIRHSFFSAKDGRGKFSVTFERVIRKRKRRDLLTHPFWSYRPRVLCEISWDTLFGGMREFPMHTGTAGILGVVRELPTTFKTCWKSVIGAVA